MSNARENVNLLTSADWDIAALRLANWGSGAVPPQVMLKQNYVAGDGGGLFRYDAGDTTTADNGGTVIVDAAGNRWKRQYAVGGVRPEWFAALADGLTDDRFELQSSHTALGLNGGEISLSPLSYGVGQDGANAWCLNFTNPVSLVGRGGIYSAIRPILGVNSSAAVLRLKPSTSTNTGFGRLQNLLIGDVGLSTRNGGVGVAIDLTDAGQLLDRHAIDGLLVTRASGGALAFSVTNDPADNVTGAYFCSTVRRSHFMGGVRLTSVGDSLLFDSITTTGTNVGFDFEGVSGVGGHPSQCVLLNYNSTAEGGQIVHRSGHFFSCVFGNLEQTVALTGGRMIDLGTSSGNWFAPLVMNSMLGAFAGAALASHVRVQNAEGAWIVNNAFLLGHPTTAATNDIEITSTCDSAWVGPNMTQRAAGLSIVDNGVGTRGVTKTPTLSNGWVAVGSGADVLQYAKSLDGMVHIWGGASGGTTTGGTTIFQLPVGFRPAGFLRCAVTVDDGGSFVVPGHLLILSTGEVQIGYVPTAGGAGAQKIFVSISFRAALGNSIVVP